MRKTWVTSGKLVKNPENLSKTQEKAKTIYGKGKSGCRKTWREPVNRLTLTCILEAFR